MDIAPGIDWIWTLGLAVVGLLAFVVGGFDKVTVVIGSFKSQTTSIQRNSVQP